MKKHGAQQQRLPKTGIKGSLVKPRTTQKKKGPVVGVFKNKIDHPQKPVVCFLR